MKQQSIKRKRVLRWLREESKKIAPASYDAFEKFNRAFFTDPEGNMYTEEMREQGIPVRMVDKQIVQCPVNHYRRLKRLYDKYGAGAVHAYFKIIGDMYIINGRAITAQEFEELKQQYSKEQEII